MFGYTFCFLFSKTENDNNLFIKCKNSLRFTLKKKMAFRNCLKKIEVLKFFYYLKYKKNLKVIFKTQGKFTFFI